MAHIQNTTFSNLSLFDKTSIPILILMLLMYSLLIFSTNEIMHLNRLMIIM